MDGVASEGLRRVTRIVAAVALVAGPLAGMLIQAFDPASTPTESTARLVADAAAHPGRTQAVLITDGFVWLMVPAALLAARLAWRRAPALSLVAGVVSLAGWVAIGIMVAEDALIAQAGHAAFDRAHAVALTDAWSNSGLVSFYTDLFVLGHLVGTSSSARHSGVRA
jgi:hypothetical protein